MPATIAVECTRGLSRYHDLYATCRVHYQHHISSFKCEPITMILFLYSSSLNNETSQCIMYSTYDVVYYVYINKWNFFHCFKHVSLGEDIVAADPRPVAEAMRRKIAYRRKNLLTIEILTTFVKTLLAFTRLYSNRSKNILPLLRVLVEYYNSHNSFLT